MNVKKCFICGVKITEPQSNICGKGFRKCIVVNEELGEFGFTVRVKERKYPRFKCHTCQRIKKEQEFYHRDNNQRKFLYCDFC